MRGPCSEWVCAELLEADYLDLCFIRVEHPVFHIREACLTERYHCIICPKVSISENKTVPRIDPWGTPHVICAGSDMSQSTETNTKKGEASPGLFQKNPPIVLIYQLTYHDQQCERLHYKDQQHQDGALSSICKHQEISGSSKTSLFIAVYFAKSRLKLFKCSVDTERLQQLFQQPFL